MFHIQYENVNGTHEMQAFSGTRDRLVAHLARFNRPIVAVYEAATPITKAVRNDLKSRKDLLKHARYFMTQV